MTTLTAGPVPVVPVEAILAVTDEIDADRRLPPSLVAAITDAGLFRLYTPREHGGAELSPDEFCAVIETIATLDASVAWCVWNGNCGFAAAMLEPGAAEQAFGAGQAVGNSARAAGVAVPTDGGFLLSGRWDLVSGSDHQRWIILFGVVMDGDQPRFAAPGMPDLRAFFVPAEHCEIVDKWHVLGLRGTSSNEVVVDGVFVADNLAPSPFAPSRIDRTLYRIPVFTTASCGAAAICLGIAQGAINDLLELAQTKLSILGGDPIATHNTVQAALAECDIQLRAARAALTDALGAVVATAASGEAVTLAQRGRVRAAMTHAARTSRDVTLRMFELGSSTVIYDGNSLQRRLRDVLVAAQHVMVQPVWLEEAGRIMVGLEPRLPVL